MKGLGLRYEDMNRSKLAGTAQVPTRVNFFMNKFKKLGFIEDNGGLKGLRLWKFDTANWTLA